MKQEMLSAVERRIDVPGLVEDLLKQAAEPALDKFIADTENPYDDSLKAVLYPLLVPLVMDVVRDMWDKVDGADGDASAAAPSA